MTAIPSGELNWAGLLTEPAVPVPARVVTDPVARSIFRIAWFPVSATKSEEPSVAIPFGVLNCAAVPVPLTKPGVPVFALPANVVTAPAEVTLRIA